MYNVSHIVLMSFYAISFQDSRKSKEKDRTPLTQGGRGNVPFGMVHLLSIESKQQHIMNKQLLQKEIVFCIPECRRIKMTRNFLICPSLVLSSEWRRLALLCQRRLCTLESVLIGGNLFSDQGWKLKFRSARHSGQ